jgi:predicted amidophosphoribosyltransferase
MKSLRALQEIIFPVRCLGCSALGLSICSSCRKNWHPHHFRRLSRVAPQFPIYSSVQYSSIASKVLLAAKEGGLIQAEELLVEALKKSLQNCLTHHGADLLIPIPSRPSIARLRGRQFALDLSMHLSAISAVPTINNLRHVRKVRDQSSLNVQERFENIKESMNSLRYLSGRALLIDDLVTSGATLEEAARALREKGIEVVAAVTACVAQPVR